MALDFKPATAISHAPGVQAVTVTTERGCIQLRHARTPHRNGIRSTLNCLWPANRFREGAERTTAFVALVIW